MEKLKYLSKIPYSICIFDNWQNNNIYKYKEYFLVIHDKVYDIYIILIDHNLNDNISDKIVNELTHIYNKAFEIVYVSDLNDFKEIKNNSKKVPELFYF